MQPMIGGGVFFSVGSAGGGGGGISFVAQFDYDSPSSFTFPTGNNLLVVISISAFASAEGVITDLNSSDLVLNDGPGLAVPDSHAAKIFWAVANFDGDKTVTWNGISSAHHVTVLVFSGQSVAPAGDSGSGSGIQPNPITTAPIASSSLLVGMVCAVVDPGNVDISTGSGFNGVFFRNGIDPNMGVEYALTGAPPAVTFDGSQDEWLALGMSFSAA